MSLRDIVRARGGELYAGGARANIPAPGHSADDRSVSLLLTNEGRVVVKSFGGSDWRAVLDDLREAGLIDRHNAPLWGAGAPSRPVRRIDVPDRAKIEIARRLWGEAAPLVGTLSARHHALRGVRRGLPGPDVARHGSQTPISVYSDPSGRFRTRPALLTAITSPEGLLTAVEITYLDPNGRRASGLRLSRKQVGQVPPSSAVRIDAAAPLMLVAEGWFTTLSATEHFGLPGWALLSARNLKTWRAPEGVEEVVIAADRGRWGLAAARELRGALRGQGVRASVEPPPPPHEDFNAWAQERLRMRPPEPWPCVRHRPEALVR